MFNSENNFIIDVLALPVQLDMALAICPRNNSSGAKLKVRFTMLQNEVFQEIICKFVL